MTDATLLSTDNSIVKALQQDSQGLSVLRQLLFTETMDLPPEFKKWVADYASVNGLPVPISQIVGFAGFTAKVAAPVNASTSTTSSAWQDLGGPSLAQLPPGGYLIVWGFQGWVNTLGKDAYMDLRINGTNPADDSQSAIAGYMPSGTSPTDGNSVMSFRVETLTADNNTILAVYKNQGNAETAYFAKRRLFALRYANL
jgi:hypothetical protein